ncbi:MAG: flagellar hook-length control protein FliK [Bdellovibrionales bacterium]|nr:flagellar hook-length control protein FliK [Bdellovibrionales bacterium]
MSGVNINSLPTKLNLLEKSSPKSSPVFSKDKVKEDISAASTASSEPVSKNEVEDRDSFSKELEKQETKVSYSKPAETKPTGMKPVPQEVPEEDVVTDINPLLIAKRKEVVVSNSDVDTLSGAKKPILKFLDSMERELGVEPEQVLAAFAAMSSEALLLPPEQSTSEFVNALELNPDQVPKAQTLYSGLLQEVSKKELDLQEQKQTDGFIHLTPNEWDMIPDKQALPRNWKAEQTAIQNQNVANLSNKFFNTSNVNGDIPEAFVDNNAPWLNSTNVTFDPSVYDEVVVPTNYVEPNMVGANAPIDLSQPTNLATNKLALNANAATVPTLGMNSEEQASLDLNFSSDTDNSELSETTDSEVDMVNPAQNSSMTKLQNFEGEVAQPVVTLKEPVKPEEVAQKAELLIKKGGGEVKMKLNPEGLGEVHLKVALHEGKVDVQLMTDSQQAKKAIESELHGLKAVLAEHKMDLRDIKVDVSQNLSRQMSEQMADQQREHARQFLSYFRENFGSGRSAAAYSGGGKTNNSQDPDDVIRTSSGHRRSSREPGRLSVVA